MRQAWLAIGAATALAAATFVPFSADARSGGGNGGGGAAMGGIAGPPRGSAVPGNKGGKGGPASHAGTGKGRGNGQAQHGQSSAAHAHADRHARSASEHRPISHRHLRNGGAFGLALTPPYYAGYPDDSCHEWTQVRTPYGVRGMWVDVCDY